MIQLDSLDHTGEIGGDGLSPWDGLVSGLPQAAFAVLLDCLFCARGLYRARGEMENRIKEQQLFAERTPALRWWPNQFRPLLASLAHDLMAAIRHLGLEGTEYARAQVATIRLLPVIRAFCGNRPR